MSEPEKTEDELDKLLEEAKTTPEIDANTIKSINEKLITIEASMKSDRENKTQEDVNKAVDALRQKVPEAFRGLPNFSASALEGILMDHAQSNETFKNAFLNRHKDAGAWDKALGGFSEEYAKGFESLPDLNATEDREAALASANRETKPADDEFDEKAISTMSTEDFNKEQAKFGVRPYGT